MKKNLKNVFKYHLPIVSEVINSVFNAFSFNVILRRELSELSGGSRNITTIFLNAANSISSRFLNVITGLVPVILAQRVTNQVNKLALLFKRSMLSQDCRNRLCVMSGNDGCLGCGHSVGCSVFNASTINVILRRERSELSGESRNIKSIFMNQMYHPGSSANELTLKAKDDNRSMLQYGRSMIEMLGVLAIIAVLSVGGIAGYSKAMEKWRSNIQRNMLSQLVRTTLELKSNLGGESFTFQGITYILNALGETPEGMIYKNGKIYDKYGTQIELAYGMRTQVNQQNQTFKIFQLLIYLTFYQTDTTSAPSVKELCRNIVYSLIPVANEVQEITVWYSDDSSWNKTSGISLYTNKTLPNATISDINQKCNITFPEKGYAHFTISLNPY